MTEEELKYHVKFEQNGDAIMYCNDNIIAHRKWDRNLGGYYWKSSLSDIQEIIDVWGKWSTSGGLIDAIKRYRKQD